MARLDFFDDTGRVGSGEVSASGDVIAADGVAGVADATNIVEASDWLSCTGFALAVAAVTDFCELLPGLSDDLFVAGAASSVLALVEEACAEAGCAWVCTAGALSGGTNGDFVVCFPGGAAEALGAALAIVSFAGFSAFGGGASAIVVGPGAGAVLRAAASAAAGVPYTSTTRR